MPKLSQEIVEQKKANIEDAAKELFIQQGFHATSMRDIASKAEVSLGNLYNYYATKEAILESMINKYHQVIDAKLNAMFDELTEPLHPESLKHFGMQVQDMVNQHSDYWLLMYIDVLEFQNTHFRKMFDSLSRKFQKRYSAYFEELKQKQLINEDTDPAFGFSAIYMQFFNYFLVEKLFQGNKHLGLSDEQVIEKLAGIFYRGIFRQETSKQQQAANPS